MASDDFIEIYKVHAENYIQEHNYSCDAETIVEQVEKFIKEEFYLFDIAREVYPQDAVINAAEESSNQAFTEEEKRQYKDVFLYIWRRWRIKYIGFPNMENIFEENNVEIMRRQLSIVEENIIQQSKIEDIFEKHVPERVHLYLLQTRCDILNRMFKLHATESEIKRFEYVNKRYICLIQELNIWHRHMQKQVAAIRGLNGERLKYVLLTSLHYSHNLHNPQLYAMEEDDFYGSRWNEMIHINNTSLKNSDLYCDAIAFCRGKHVYKKYESVTKGVLFFSKFKHIHLCRLAVELGYHMRYSIPDLLRMTTFNYDYTLKLRDDYQYFGRDETVGNFNI